MFKTNQDQETTSEEGVTGNHQQLKKHNLLLHKRNPFHLVQSQILDEETNLCVRKSHKEQFEGEPQAEEGEQSSEGEDSEDNSDDDDD